MESNNRDFLLEFRANNVFSFQDDMFIDFRTQVIDDPSSTREVSIRSSKPYSETGSQKVMANPCLAIVGANASGKTNLLKALAQMKHLIVTSFLAHPTEKIQRMAFKGNPAETTSLYQVDVVLDGIRHVYGFEVNDDAVIEEWAYWYPNGIKSKLFLRKGQEISFGAKQAANFRTVSISLVRSNALYLSTCAYFGLDATQALFTWFAGQTNFVASQNLNFGGRLAADYMRHPATRVIMSKIFQAADLGITNVKIADENPIDRERAQRIFRAMSDSENSTQELDSAEFPLINIPTVRFEHRFKSEDLFLEPNEESHGTGMWWLLSGWILNTLIKGSVLVIDEMDMGLHPALVSEAVNLFQSPESNKNNAQLIFTSHAISLLDRKSSDHGLRRDQFLVVEKNHFGASQVFPLSDMVKQKDEAILRRYLAGYYGGIPLLDFLSFSNELKEQEKISEVVPQ